MENDIIEWVMGNVEDAPSPEDSEIEDISMEYDDRTSNTCMIITLRTENGDEQYKLSVERVR